MVGVWLIPAALPASTSRCTSLKTEGSFASNCTFLASTGVKTLATVSHTLPLAAQATWFRNSVSATC